MLSFQNLQEKFDNFKKRVKTLRNVAFLQGEQVDENHKNQTNNQTNSQRNMEKNDLIHTETINRNFLIFPDQVINMFL